MPMNSSGEFHSNVRYCLLDNCVYHILRYSFIELMCQIILSFSSSLAVHSSNGPPLFGPVLPAFLVLLYSC